MDYPTPMFIKSESPGRNEPCPCGSGKKYKKCHEPIDASGEPCDSTFWDWEE
jgi:hypothetical protein